MLVLYDGFSMQALYLDVLDGIVQPFLEFFEIFLVQENLVFIKDKISVPFLSALAFRDGKIKILVPTGGLYIKEVGPLAGAHRFGIDILSIFSIHNSLFYKSMHKNKEISEILHNFVKKF